MQIQYLNLKVHSASEDLKKKKKRDFFLNEGYVVKCNKKKGTDPLFMDLAPC